MANASKAQEIERYMERLGSRDEKTVIALFLSSSIVLRESVTAVRYVERAVGVCRDFYKPRRLISILRAAQVGTEIFGRIVILFAALPNEFGLPDVLDARATADHIHCIGRSHAMAEAPQAEDRHAGTEAEHFRLGTGGEAEVIIAERLGQALRVVGDDVRIHRPDKVSRIK